MVSLERQGLGARTGLGLLGVPGDGSERPSLLGVEGDTPGLCGWTSFGFGAKGGLCTPELIIASLFVFVFCQPSEISAAETDHPLCPDTSQEVDPN